MAITERREEPVIFLPVEKKKRRTKQEIALEKSNLEPFPDKPKNTDKVLTDFEMELKQGVIKKTKNKKGEIEYFNAKNQRINENKELLTKTGKVYKQVSQRNKKEKVVFKTFDESDSDTEFEFEISNVKEPPVIVEDHFEKPEKVEKVVEKPTEPFIPLALPVPVSNTDVFLKQQEELRNKQDEEMKRLLSENKKLKEGLIFNDHLSRISSMAKNVKLKF